MGLLENKETEKVSVDADQSDALLRLLDAVVIKLEGGTDDDLKILDIKPPPEKKEIKEVVVKKEEDSKDSKEIGECFNITSFSETSIL